MSFNPLTHFVDLYEWLDHQIQASWLVFEQLRYQNRNLVYPIKCTGSEGVQSLKTLSNDLSGFIKFIGAPTMSLIAKRGEKDIEIGADSLDNYFELLQRDLNDIKYYLFVLYHLNLIK